jgi:hypothetical protein
MKRRIFILTTSLLLSTGFATLALSHALPGTIHTRDMSTPVLFNNLLGGGSSGQKAPAPASQDAYEISNDADFDAKTRIFAMRPFGKAEYFFNINLPDDWAADTTSNNQSSQSSENLLGNIAHFQSPMIGTMQAFVDVQALPVKKEISAANWLKYHILSNTYTPDGEVEEINRQHANIHYVYIRDGISYYVYATVRLNGNVAMLARFEVPLPLKDYLAFIQKKSIDSFSLVYPSEENIEPTKSFTVVDSIKFSYPQSWEPAAADFKDINRLTMQLLNKNDAGTVEGLVYTLAVRREEGNSLLKEVDKLKQFFDVQMDLTFSKLVSSGKSPASDKFPFNREEVYEVESRKKGQSLQEIHLVVLGNKDWYVFMFLVTPREGERFYTWANNIQSFNDIVQSVSLISK